MTPSAIFFLFALATGTGNSVNLNALGAFADAQTCSTIKSNIENALARGKPTAQFICVASDSLAALGQAPAASEQAPANTQQAPSSQPQKK